MRRELVHGAFGHKAGKIPHNVELTQELMARFCTFAGISPKDFGDFADNHIAKCGLNEKDVCIGDEHYKDEFGVVFDRTYDKDIGIIHDFVIPEPDADLIALPPIDREAVRARVTAFMNDSQDRFKFAKIGFALFERAWSLCGLENLFCYMLTDKPFVDALLGKIAARNAELVSIALECGVDGVYFGDDYGSQRGMLFSPELFRELFLPQWRMLFELVKKAGKTTCLHSCGNIADVLGDLSAAGLDVYQTVQPELYDFAALKAGFPKLSYYGGISVQRDLPAMQSGQIAALVRDTAAVLGKGGGYIAAPTHQVTDDVPVENVMALIESFKRL